MTVNNKTTTATTDVPPDQTTATPSRSFHPKKLIAVVGLLLVSVALVYSPTGSKVLLQGGAGVLDSQTSEQHAPPVTTSSVGSTKLTTLESMPPPRNDSSPNEDVNEEQQPVHGTLTQAPSQLGKKSKSTVQKNSEQRQLLFTRTTGTNAPSCTLQPNQTDIESYDRCPLPGLNNLLYSQINRWYCAFRDRRHLRLRDRTCQKVRGTAEPYRYSTILQIDYETAKNVYKREASVCWGDWKKQDKSCEWGDIPQFYGTPDWWVARSMIDFHPIYYRVADDMLRRAFGVASDQPIPPFITVHLRRGDYDKHCKLMTSKKEPAWLSFRATKGLRRGIEGCYPSLNSVTESLLEIQKIAGMKHVFIATNSPKELEEVAASVPGVIMMDHPAFNFSRYESQELLGGHGQAPDVIERSALYKAKYAHKFRDVDRVIVEMCIMIRGKHFLFNKYSSMSATVYEQARVNGNMLAKDSNMITW